MHEQNTVSGDFSQQSLNEVLNELAQEKATGLLQINEVNEIWFHEGEIYLAVTASSSPVADVLFGAGSVSEETIGDLLADSEANAAGTIAEQYPEASAVLDRLLHEFNLSSLFELIVPSSHPYVFHDGRRHPVGPRFAEPVGELMSQAERRLAIWTKIAARIPNTSMAFRLTGVLPREEEERVITSDEWRYLALLDGRNSVADVISQTGESAFRVCSSLYRLLLEGLIEEG